MSKDDNAVTRRPFLVPVIGGGLMGQMATRYDKMVRFFMCCANFGFWRLASRRVRSGIVVSAIIMLAQLPVHGVIVNVEKLTELNSAIAKNGQKIKLKAGVYDFSELPGKSRAIRFSGSNNVIDLRGVHVKVTVGQVRNSYIIVSGDNNLIVGGEIEDIYNNGIETVTDFSAYNRDKRNLAFGLRGDAVMTIHGKRNTLRGIKLTVRGSWPYGYGSYYGIGGPNTYGLNKRCGILIKDEGNTIDGAELQMRAFGHGIYMQDKADKTVIKNCLVEGRLRKTADLYQETDPRDLPRRSNYRFPNRRDFNMDSPGSYPIPKDSVHSLCEDGIRMYDIAGSVMVENCMVKKMRGGIRLYLGGPATVKDCTVIHCEYTAYNLPNRGKVIQCEGDFSFGPLSDYRGGRSNTKVEWTILRSPHATGNHNIMDLLGNDHHIVLNRQKGPIDRGEKREIVVTGRGSTIINKTEYTILLAKGSRGNKVTSYGPVRDQGERNDVRSIE